MMVEQDHLQEQLIKTHPVVAISPPFIFFTSPLYKHSCAQCRNV